MIEQFHNEVREASVIEFGSAAGIPSIAMAKLGAEFVCASDYPSKSVIANLKRNIARNGVESKVQAIDHIWGGEVSPLIEANGGRLYDIALATECLWRHECHTTLLSSVRSVVKPGGSLFITYSHHVPGLEAEDDHFIELALGAGFTIERREEIEAPHMWNEQRTTTIYFIKFIVN